MGFLLSLLFRKRACNLYAMPLTRAARIEAHADRQQNAYERLIYEGWYNANIPAYVLEELGIEYEVIADSSAYSTNALVYAPFWVFGVWYNAGMPGSILSSRWNAVRSLLIITRDSREEQKMVSAELTMDSALPLSAKTAAVNLVDILTGRRKRNDVQHP